MWLIFIFVLLKISVERYYVEVFKFILIAISKDSNLKWTQLYVQYNLGLVTLNLVTTCDLATILQRPFFNLLHKIIRFSDIMQFSDSFSETKSVTKSRLHCN